MNKTLRPTHRLSLRYTWPLLAAASLSTATLIACSGDDDVDPETPAQDAGTDASIGDAGTGTDATTAEDASSGEDATTPEDASSGEDAATDGEAPAASCTTSITAAQSGSFVELCALEAPVRHVRIAGAQTPNDHASVQVFFGFADAPTSANTGNTALAAGQFKAMFYGGGVPFPPATIQTVLGAARVPESGSAAFLNAPFGACFDLYPGDAAERPAFALWIDGQNGADCSDPATLTVASARALRSSWGDDSDPAITASAKTYFYQAAGLTTTPQITLSGQAALTVEQIRAGLPQ